MRVFLDLLLVNVASVGTVALTTGEGVPCPMGVTPREGSEFTLCKPSCASVFDSTCQTDVMSDVMTSLLSFVFDRVTKLLPSLLAL